MTVSSSTLSLMRYISSNFVTLNVMDLIHDLGRWTRKQYRRTILCDADMGRARQDKADSITVNDLQKALRTRNRESAGVLGQRPVKGLDVTVPVPRRASVVGMEFEEYVIRYDSEGSILRLAMWRVYRLKRKATIPERYQRRERMVLAIYMLPGIEYRDGRQCAKYERDKQEFSEGLDYAFLRYDHLYQRVGA